LKVPAGQRLWKRGMMVTFFAVPKAFKSEFAVIQRNAICSWANLHPLCEILLLGDDTGTAEMAAEVGAIHIPTIHRNETGTPLLDSVFAEAQRHATFGILCYLNSDIILFKDFLSAVAEVSQVSRQFLAVGRRTNLDVTEPLDFSAGWNQKLKEAIRVRGALEPPNGLDYFIFSRGLWARIPPFAIGRMAWDQWLLYDARSSGVPVVDCTARVCVVHQKHGHSHHPGGRAACVSGAEAQRNVELAGGYRRGYTLRDATHNFTEQGIRRRVLPYDLRRCLVTPVTAHRFVRPLVRWARAAMQKSTSFRVPG
jgi:hypothetical protein